MTALSQSPALSRAARASAAAHPPGLLQGALLLLASLALLLLAHPARAIDIREVTSPGGIRAWLVQEPSIPFTALEIRFQGGASLDAPGKRGAANLMMGLLEEGAGDMDARSFATRAEELAADFTFRVDDDAAAVSARFLTENREASVELLRAALTAPRFDADAVERVRGQVLASIRSDAKDPDTIASQALDRIAFGDDPYGSSPDGTEESVAALTVDDLRAAREGLMARDRLHIAAVGDISEADLGALLDRLLGDLPATGTPQPAPTAYAAPGGVEVVPFATPQSVILFAQQGIQRDDPDFFAAYVLNETLGGGRFSARLMRELREKRGLTYGAYSYIANRDRADLIMGRLATANPRVGEATAIIREEWARAARDGITQEELDAVKTYLTGSYPLRFDGNAPIARILVGMQMMGYGPDYINTRNAKVEAVTLADVKRVAERLLDPEHLQFVVVGEPGGLGN